MPYKRNIFQYNYLLLLNIMADTFPSAKELFQYNYLLLLNYVAEDFTASCIPISIQLLVTIKRQGTVRTDSFCLFQYNYLLLLNPKDVTKSTSLGISIQLLVTIKRKSYPFRDSNRLISIQLLVTIKRIYRYIAFCSCPHFNTTTCYY